MSERRGIRVLVCGGREYGLMPKGCPSSERARHREKCQKEVFLLEATLDAIHVDKGVKLVIHGDASGADSWAAYWASGRCIQEQPYPANWYPKGRAGGLDRSAGPKRNAKMIAEGKPDLIVAFPGGAGTADCVRQARAAGIEIMEAGDGRG